MVCGNIQFNRFNPIGNRGSVVSYQDDSAAVHPEVSMLFAPVFASLGLASVAAVVAGAYTWASQNQELIWTISPLTGPLGN